MYEIVIFTAGDYFEDYYEYDYEETPAPGICHAVLLPLNLFQTVVNSFMWYKIWSCCVSQRIDTNIF